MSFNLPLTKTEEEWGNRDNIILVFLIIIIFVLLVEGVKL